jgi:hypothetical protein
MEESHLDPDKLRKIKHSRRADAIEDYRQLPYVIEIDLEKEVILSMDSCQVKILPWENNTIRIIPRRFIGNQVDIWYENNEIFFDFENYKVVNPCTDNNAGFIVNVPKQISLNIQAGNVNLYDCKISKIESRSIFLNGCTLQHMFNCLCENGLYKNCVFGKNSLIMINDLELKNCYLESLDVVPYVADRLLEIRMRNVRGESVSLDLRNSQNVIIRMHHVYLKELSVTSKTSTGIIILEGSKISKVSNSSQVQIVHRLAWQHRKSA